MNDHLIYDSYDVQIGSIGSKLYQHIGNDDIHLSAEDREKLNSIQISSSDSSDGSTVSDLQIELNNKANKDDIPTKVSQLENDLNFLSEIPDYYTTESEVKQMIASYGSGDGTQFDFVTKDEVQRMIQDAIIDAGSIQSNQLINFVKTSELDSFGLNMNMANINTPKYYVVTYGDYAIGTLKMFSDISRHVLVQMLDTQCTLKDGQLDFLTHTDSAVYTYVRMFSYDAPGLSGVTEPFTWTDWARKDVYDDEVSFMGIATPTTVPYVNIATNKNMCYIAVTPGTYTNFIQIDDDPIVVNEGETVLMMGRYSTSMESKSFWEKTVLN